MSRYANAHASRNGPGDSRPTAMQIIEDEGLVGKMTDKVFLVTGVSSGIGIETLRALHATGAHVIGTVRNLDKGNAVVEEVERNTPSEGKIDLVLMDMASLTSVRKGAEEIKQLTQTLNVAVFNAGVMATPFSRTVDGFELQFATNHLSHYLLFNLLLPLLLSSATPSFHSRVISLSSMGHRTAPTRPDDYNYTSDPASYSPWPAYGQSKTSNIYLANAITRKYSGRNLHALSLHPGGIDTGLQVHVSHEQKAQWAGDPEVGKYMKNAAQGAATSVYAAVGREWEGKGGVYLADCREQGPHKGTDPFDNWDEGYAEWAFDVEAEERLWKESARMVGLTE